jgi:hypothetical protein
MSRLMHAYLQGPWVRALFVQARAERTWRDDEMEAEALSRYYQRQRPR